MKSRRPRVSLLSLLLLTALVATSTTAWRLWQSVGPLKAEVRRLRLDAGILSIDDPKKLYAIGVETHVTKAWKWRVHVPAGRRFAVRVAVDQIPMTGSAEPSLPKPSGGLEIHRQIDAAGEVEVTLAAEKTLDGTVRWNLREGNVTRYVPVPKAASRWLLEGSIGHTGGGRVGWQLQEQPGKPVVLLHQRVYYQQGQIPPPNASESGDGVMAWIEAIE